MTNLEIITTSLANTYSHLEQQISHLSDKGELDLDPQSTVIVAGLLLIFSTIAVVRWLYIKDLNQNNEKTSDTESTQTVINSDKPHIVTDQSKRLILPVYEGPPVTRGEEDNFLTQPKPGYINRRNK